MALVNDVKKEINAKIVYIGPKGSGKGAAIRYVYSKLKPDCRSELKVIPAGDHQMLFFDFIYPQVAGSSGYTLRFHIYTFLAGDDGSPPWKMLLKGVDGLVFMADMTGERKADNVECASLLGASLAHYGMSLADTPLSVQGNCVDMKNASSVTRGVSELFPGSDYCVSAVSVAGGEGVLEGLHVVLKSILERLGQSSAAMEQEPAGEQAIELDSSCVTLTAPDSDQTDGGDGHLLIEPAGDPKCDKEGVISVPLRVRDIKGVTNTEFTLKISLST